MLKCIKRMYNTIKLHIGFNYTELVSISSSECRPLGDLQFSMPFGVFCEIKCWSGWVYLQRNMIYSVFLILLQSIKLNCAWNIKTNILHQLRIILWYIEFVDVIVFRFSSIIALENASNNCPWVYQLLVTWNPTFTLNYCLCLVWSYIEIRANWKL